MRRRTYWSRTARAAGTRSPMAPAATRCTWPACSSPRSASGQQVHDGGDRQQEWMQHKLERRGGPARAQALADRELRDEEPDGEQRTRSGRGGEQRCKALDGQRHLHVERDQQDREGDRPDETILVATVASAAGSAAASP